MTPECRRARNWTFAARALAVVATGGLSWYLALPIAQYFQHALSDPMRIGIGCAFALVALFISKRALDFTEDCMNVPDALAHGAHDGQAVNCRKKSCRFHVEDGADPAQSERVSAAPASDGVRTASNKTTVADGQGIKVSLHSDGDGTFVTVTITGVSSAKFKAKQGGLRHKIESVGGVKWSNPKNLGNCTREMVGRVIDPSRRETVVARLQEIAGGK